VSKPTAPRVSKTPRQRAEESLGIATGLGNSMDVPFEEGGAGELSDDHVHYSGGLVVMAATIDVPEVGMRPALVFRFATPDGQFYPPVCLVADDDQLAKLRPLISEAIASARRAVKGSEPCS
jgi:hypothetical protein